MKIVYEPHPVTPERKRELREQGFKIVDIRFAPEGHKPAAVAPAEVERAVEDEPIRRGPGRPRKVTEDADS